MVGKAERAIETNGEGTYFQEGDHVRIKRTQEIGSVLSLKFACIAVQVAVQTNTVQQCLGL
jgi:hypothetical protein